MENYILNYLLNIAAFGGDPNRVTLAGQDSGATLASILKVN